MAAENNASGKLPPYNPLPPEEESPVATQDGSQPNQSQPTMVGAPYPQPQGAYPPQGAYAAPQGAYSPQGAYKHQGAFPPATTTKSTPFTT